MNIFKLCRDPLVYVLHMVMTFAVIFMGYFMQQFEDYRPKLDWHSIMLIGIGCLCGLPIISKRKNTSHRIFHGFCFYGSLIYNVCILSTMINLMKVPLYETQVDSIQQIINDAYELTGDNFTLTHLKKQNEVYFLIFISYLKFSFCYNFFFLNLFLFFEHFPDKRHREA